MSRGRGGACGVVVVRWGLVYGLALFVVATVLWMNVLLDMDADRGKAMRMGGIHLVYGAVLGAGVWLGVLV